MEEHASERWDLVSGPSQSLSPSPLSFLSPFPLSPLTRQFRMVMKPNEGFYQGGRFVFTFKIGEAYPHEPPKVHCDTKVYHPNIDNDGMGERRRGGGMVGACQWFCETRSMRMALLPSPSLPHASSSPFSLSPAQATCA